jgi:hypothetical protein
VEQRKQGHGWDGRFLGSWARLNCENMPVIPALIVRRNLNDPRRVPYLLVWKDERHDGRIMEAVRLVCYSPGPLVELKRTDGSTKVLRIVSQTIPRNGGQALLMLCPYCDTPRRFVYGWEWNSFSGWSNRARSISWRCRSCAQLRYSSEGGYLRPNYRGLGSLGAMLRALPRGYPVVVKALQASRDALAVRRVRLAGPQCFARF